MRWPDIPRVTELEQQSFPMQSWRAPQFWNELAQEPEQVYYVVAEEGATAPTDSPQVVGYAGASAFAPVADLRTIAVGSQQRGRGIGEQLLRHVGQWAQEQHCRTMLLEVAVTNDPAQRLYTSFGAQQVDRRRDYYGPGADALVLELALPLNRVTSEKSGT